MSINTCAAPPRGLLFGRMAEQSPPTYATWLHLGHVGTPIVEGERERRLDHTRPEGEHTGEHTSKR